MTAALRGPAGWGVRTRLTAVATAVTAATMALAGLLLVLGARSALLATLDDASRQRGAEVAGLVDAGRLPDPLPVTGAAVVQVLDADRRVRSSSPGGDRLAPLLDPAGVATVRSGGAVRLEGARVGSQEAFRVQGRRAGQGGAQTVLVASSLAEVERGVAVARLATLVAVPALVLVVGLLVWRVSGSALRPVEQLRLGAAAVSAPPAGSGGPAPRSLPVPPSDDEVARLARTLNDMLARLEDASARQRAFVADAAHELRSPLGSLRTQLEVALARPDRQDWPGVAAGSLQDVERMAALVDDLLLLARLGAAPPAAEPVDLAELVAARVQVPRRVPVTARASDGAAIVVVNRRALERVLDNLLDNAARHASSAVSVRVRAAGSVVTLEVVDDGPGIADADRERVFERFTRLDAARTRDDGGAGLGLAIVRAVVEQAGGTVVAAGRDDGRPGARLVVTMPQHA